MSILKQLSIQMSEERQISVDPISLHQQRESAASYYLYPPPPPPAPEKNRFLSYSLPNSASSSPAGFNTKKQQKSFKKHEGLPPLSSLGRQNSVALANLERLREIHLRRSKSCGEGRASRSSVDFDLLSSRKINLDNNIITDGNSTNQAQDEKIQVLYAENPGTDFIKEGTDSHEEKFKCGLMCPFLPSFNRDKTVKTVRSSNENIIQRPVPRTDSCNTTNVSRRVSLEKFECGSWRSSAVINCEDQDRSSEDSFFFDLPVELIRCSNANDTESPITTAFVFDKTTSDDNNNNNNNNQVHLKGVLKNIRAKANTSSSTPNESKSPRHVRFSTSSPTTSSCVSPRLHNVRDDFNAFLEAQSV